jgi:hypothetical protein
MHTIHQVTGAWEVREGGEVTQKFPLKNFEIHSDSSAYIKAIEFVRKEDGYGTYYDFTIITAKDSRF